MISIALSTLILINSMPNPSDLLAIDDFIDHLKEHLKEGNSIIEFIELHYGSQANDHLADHSQHGKLPFNNSNNTIAQTLFIPDLTCDFNQTFENYMVSKTYFHCFDFYSFNSIKSLHKPPIA